MEMSRLVIRMVMAVWVSTAPPTWFPLAAGRLSGAASPVSRVAAQLKATPSQVALAWLLARSPVMLPIPGTSKVERLEENVAAAGLNLDDKTMQELSISGERAKHA